MITAFVWSNVTPKVMSMFLRFLILTFCADMYFRRRPHLHIAIANCLWICRVLDSGLTMRISTRLKGCAGLRLQTDVSLAMMILIFVLLLVLGDSTYHFGSSAHLALQVFDLYLRWGWLCTIVIWLNRCCSVVTINWCRLTRAATWANIVDILSRRDTLTR